MRLARRVAGALVGVAVVAGCSSGPEPANDTLPSAEPTAADASETLTPLGPPDFPMPPEARAQTSEAAKAFVTYYMTVYNAAQAAMDAQYLRTLSRNCTTCDRIAGEIESDAEAGYSYKGGAVKVEAISAPALDGATAEAAFSLTQEPLTVVDSAGQPVADLDFAENRNPSSGAILTWDETHQAWVMNQWDVG